ncbi:MAG: hypothetical protein H7Z37_01340 [Pyrinomonadaceae bacterium]|nr:hypothetical protein [Pyrinomonadaceae bacterium]
MNIIIASFFIALSLFGSVSTKTAKVKAKDLQQLTGKQWRGNLTYLDYGKNEKVSIPSNLTVTRSTVNNLSWIFDYQYPDEPKANNKETIVISKDGKIIDDETVIERTSQTDGTLKIVTEKSGTDNDKKATFRFTYLINKTSFSIKKEVKLDDAKEFFERNEYSWKI